MKSLSWNIMRFEMRDMVKEVPFLWASYIKYYTDTVTYDRYIMLHISYMEYAIGICHAICFLPFCICVYVIQLFIHGDPRVISRRKKKRLCFPKIELCLCFKQVINRSVHKLYIKL